MITFIEHLTNEVERIPLDLIIKICLESGMQTDMLYELQISTETVVELKMALIRSLVFSFAIARGVLTEEEIRTNNFDDSLLKAFGAFVGMLDALPERSTKEMH